MHASNHPTTLIHRRLVYFAFILNLFIIFIWDSLYFVWHFQSSGQHPKHKPMFGNILQGWFSGTMLVTMVEKRWIPKPPTTILRKGKVQGQQWRTVKNKISAGTVQVTITSCPGGQSTCLLQTVKGQLLRNPTKGYLQFGIHRCHQYSKKGTEYNKWKWDILNWAMGVDRARLYSISIQ